MVQIPAWLCEPVGQTGGATETGCQRESEREREKVTDKYIGRHFEIESIKTRASQIKCHKLPKTTDI